MYRLRSVSKNDIDDLYTLSKFYTFINLPSDKEVISLLIDRSIKAFEAPSKSLAKNHYFFVLEDLDHKKVIGCSIIHAQHGTPKEPHFYLKVSQEHKYCKTINTGFIHGTLKLGHDTNGPTEIGGLILHPDYRKNKSRLGKQLSFVRFLFIAKNLNLFKDEIHSELLPPFDKDGNSPLWEAIGRKFLNMNYHDADILSRSNKEFILSLFPSEVIYETLLPMEARHSIGKVGTDTQPVKAMLEKIGFKYIEEVDPFDGGPHYRCMTSEISPIKNCLTNKIKISDETLDINTQDYLIDISIKQFTFMSGMIKASRDKDYLYVKSVLAKKFNLIDNQEITSIPL